MDTIEFTFNVNGHPIAAKLDLPPGPARSRVVLPLFQALTDAVVDLAEKNTVALGKSISCKKGCGACCRQLVPISQVEAHHLAELIESFPADRQDQIQSRFSNARETLNESGLLASLENSEDISDSDLNDLGIRYFAIGIPCPFLEDESCSIHPARPLACREYLVTSPASFCADPSPELIERIELPGQLSRSILHVGTVSTAGKSKWVPLILAPRWAALHPEPAATEDAREVVSQTLEQVWGYRP